jgi:hypothetical protein
MYTVWYVDKYKITFKLISSDLSRPGIIDARARYRATARRLRNAALQDFTVDQLFLSGGNTDISVVRIAQQSVNTFCLVTHKKRGNHWRPSH